MYHNPLARTYTYPNQPSDPQIQAFHQALPDYNTTALIPLPSLAKELGLGQVFVKDESHRFGLPAFKILGASWAIFRAVAAICHMPLSTSLEELGVRARQEHVELVTCSEGNWGRATARMARYLGVPVTVFVPHDMDDATRAKIESEGAEVLKCEGDYDQSIVEARKEADRGKLMVMDFAWEGYEEIPQWVVEGYTTMLTETDRQLQESIGQPLTHAIAAVGVGSWAQAVAMHYKSSSSSQSTVIAVEPETAASLQTSLRAGKIVPIATSHTIMNGMNCGTVSYTAWDVLRHGIDASVVVSDKEVHEDLLYLHQCDVKNGPCGAATLSALKRCCREKERLGLNESSVVVLFSTEGARNYEPPL